MLDVVHNWYFGVACENEVAVHAMDREIRGHRSLGCCETLCDNSTTVYASRSGWVPEWSGIGEDVLFQVSYQQNPSRLGDKRQKQKRTGAIAASSVNSNTFSIADLFGLRGGGGTRVVRLAMIPACERNPRVERLGMASFAADDGMRTIWM